MGRRIEVFDEGTITGIDESPFFIEIGEPQNFGEIFLLLNGTEKFSQRDLSLSHADIVNGRTIQLRHVQPPLLPARGAARDQAARRREHRDGRARVRRRRGTRMGPRRTLVEPLLRRRLGGHRPLGRVPVRARDGARAARALGAAGGTAGPLRAPHGARARGEPGGVRAARRRSSRAIGLSRAPRARRARAPARHARRSRPPSSSCCCACSRPAAGSRSRCPSSPRPVCSAASASCSPGACRRRACCGGSYVVYLVGLHGGLPRSVEPRREHRAAALRGDPDRDPDALAAALAAAAARRPRAVARRRLEPDAARRQLRQDERRPGGRPGVLGARRRSSSAATSPRRTASRRSTPSATGPPPTSRPQASRSRGAGSGRTTSHATACSTPSSTAPLPRRGSARSASATSSCPTLRSTTAPRRRAL